MFATFVPFLAMFMFVSFVLLFVRARAMFALGTDGMVFAMFFLPV